MKSIGSRIAAIVVAAAAGIANAQYPSRPITLIVPFAACGPTDTLARIMGERMSRSLGGAIVVENVAGAGGTIANNRMQQAAADGYTVAIGHLGTHVLAPAVQQLNVDYVNGFEPVAMIATNPQVMVSKKDLPAKDLKELVALAKAQPGKLNYASPGSGSVPHVGMELFKQQTGADFTHVPYKGAGPAMQDVIAGNVQVTVATPPSLLGFVQSGRMRALALAAKQRHPQLPDVPTAAEAGFPGFELEAWVALFAPAGTPPEAINRLTAAVKEALASPEAMEKIRVTGMTQRYLPPAELDGIVRSDLAYWSKVITNAKIKAD